MNGLPHPLRTRRALRSALVTSIAAATALSLAACSSGDAEPVATASAAGASSAINEEARAMLPGDIVDNGTLSMTADFQYAPFTYLEDGEYAGMDFELGNAIAEALGLEPEWSTENSFGAIVPSVQNGRVDAAIESININPERLQAVSFVGYITTFDVLLVPEGNPGDLDPADLCGANMAMTTGGASNPLLDEYSADCEAAGEEPITLNEYSTTDASVLAVSSQRVDGFAVGSAVAPLQVDGSNGAVESAGEITRPDSDELMRSAVAGVVVAKDRPELGEAILTVIQQMQEDGTHLALLEKYGFDESAMVPAEFVE